MAIVGELIGPTGTQYGVELYPETLDHCRAATAAWCASRQSPPPRPYTQLVQGNGLEIDATRGEGAVGFDRIYVGAKVEPGKVQSLVQLLRLGGILVGPGTCT